MCKNIKGVKIINFSQHGDDRGYMSVIENNKDIPFEIKRIFYMYGADVNTIRGQHANKKSEFVLINVAGSSKVLVKDGFGNENIYLLDKPNKGIYLPKMTWKEMYDFSSDSVLLVLSNEYYDANEYVRDFEEFQKIVSGQTKKL